MTSSTRTRTGRVTAAGIAGAVMLALGVGVAAAAPVIDPDATGSLTVHKYEAPDGVLPVLPNDGSEIVGGVPGATPLPGVEFTVYEVTGLDLATNDGWEDAADLQEAFNPATVLPGAVPATVGGYTLTEVDDVVTDVDGEALFDDLDIALYLVVESSTPAGFTPVPSFMVTVPLTLDDEWVYDVHVYPKNPAFAATKVVTDAVDQDPATVGDQVLYAITGDLPAQGLDAYRVVDTLGAALTYVPDATQSDLTVAVTGTGGSTLALTTGYTVTVTGQTIQVDLTPAGLTALAAAKTADATAQVVLTLVVTVNGVGEISNVADVYPSLAAIANGLPTVTPAVESKWGSVTIEKSSSDASITALAGATFEVYYTTAATWNGVPGEGGAVPVSVGTATTFETLADGTITVGPLRYSDFANGIEVVAGSPEFRYYWLREVVALDGHELLAQPVGFTIEDEDETTAVPTDTVSEIVNVPSNAGFELPFTGGMGTVWFTVAGVLLIGGATLLLVRQRRSRA